MLKTFDVRSRYAYIAPMTTTNNTTEKVTGTYTDSFGVAWGRINGKLAHFTFAVDPNGSWVDSDGDYHFNVQEVE